MRRKCPPRWHPRPRPPRSSPPTEPPPPLKPKRAPTPAAPPTAPRASQETKPDRPKRAMAKSNAAPIGLLVGVAAACSILGVLITVVAMKVFVH